MSQHATTRSFLFRKAPKKISLLGDNTRPEPATHIIEFPGGAIELSRTSEGNYWAHIMVNHDFALDNCDGLRAAFGAVIGSRIDYEFPAEPNIIAIPDEKQIRQIAILIQPRREEESPASVQEPTVSPTQAGATAS
jgi:hypothetical protein